MKTISVVAIEKNSLPLKLFLDQREEDFIGGEPVDAAEVVPGEPAGGLMLIQMQGLRQQRAHEAVHRQMELRIVPFDRMEELVDADLRRELLADFPDQRSLRRLSDLHFPARELPPVLEIAITPLGGKYLVSLADNRCYYFDCFHGVGW